jgi:hypothetical protein
VTEKTSLRDQLLTGRPSKTKRLTAPGGREVDVAPMTAHARAELVKLTEGKAKDRQHQLEVVHPFLVVSTLRDPETGALLFGPDDQAAVMELDSSFLDEVVRAALEVSGLKAEALEEAGKDSAPNPTGAHSTV